MADDNINSDTPPEGEEDRAIWMIQRLTRATLGKTLSVEEASSLFHTAKAKMMEAMAQAAPSPGSGDSK